MLSVAYGIRANTWAVMTDELQVARLATSIAHDLSLVPTIHGEYYAAHSQLYPLLLAPIYGLLDPTEAAAAAHVLNALLLLSAAVPAFLLTRSVTGSTGAGYVAALLTAVTPWLVLSTTLLTENAAYAAWTWSVLLCHRTIARPGPARDCAALAGLLLAYTARTQLLVLAVALPGAVVLHEVGCAVRRLGLLAGIRIGVVRAIAGHQVLGLAFLGAGLVAAALWAAGDLATPVGNYSVPFEGDLVPTGFWRSAVEHFDQVVLGVGVLPVVLAGSWVATTLVRPALREAHALAVLIAVLVPLVIFQVTSFDLRFTPEQFIQDRYLVYLVPLFAVGCAAWLTMRERLWTRLVATGMAGVVVVALLGAAPHEETVVFWAAPGATFRPALSSAAASLNVSDVAFLQIAAALAIAGTLLVAHRRPRAALVAVSSLLVAYGAVQTVHAYERYAGPSLILADAGNRSWIDDAVPDGRSVALVPGGVDGPTDWWEAEFWNREVDRALRIGHTTTLTPFPVLDLAIDVERGRLLGTQPSDYVVVSRGEARFGLASSRRIAEESSLRLLRVDRPYRLAWVTRGLTRDGWTTPGRPAIVRVFGNPRSGRRAVSLTLAASALSTRRVPFFLAAPGDSTSGTVDPGGARPPVEVTVCAPAGGYVDVSLATPRGTRLRNGRLVSLHVERIAISRAWPCSAS